MYFIFNTKFKFTKNYYNTILIKGEGCNYFNKNCIINKGTPYTNEHCLNPQEPFCISGNLSKRHCHIAKYNSNIEIIINIFLNQM